MVTLVHIPKPLLRAVDRRAGALNISRNRLIVQTLQREVAVAAKWPPGFFERLETRAPSVAAVDDMLLGIQAQRRSKKPIAW
jgi:hypothetical protein